MLHLLALSAALNIAPARPLEWPTIAAFLVAARFEEEGLTGAQRMLLERH